MSLDKFPEIQISGANTNNLKNISLSIPHKKLIVVTGVSGSGKSSLIFDLIAQEGQRRYLETIPSFSRQFIGKLSRPEVESIQGLSPVITIGQSTSGMHVRSTVGTMSDLYDLFRLLYARVGETDLSIELSRSLFSFNSEKGKCKRCNGIGKEEQIDLNLLIKHPERSIREGALAPTLPTGYIMYSQVTIDVLNQVCEAEGFNVDIPWKDLTEHQKNVVLFGSEKIKVPFGKHSLESRLKWKGIKAKPREDGYYRGMIPIMSDILRRDRNANILKYVKAVVCPDCNGTRLNADALSVKIYKKTIADLSKLELYELKDWLATNKWNEIATPIVDKLLEQIDRMIDLGLGHLVLDRSAKSLSPSEIQRIRVANQINDALSNVLYVFDEPSIGLHADENRKMIAQFQRLVQKGNTVIVVEHNLQTILSADHIIDIGPGSGANGGEVIFNGALLAFKKNKALAKKSPTYRAINSICEPIPSKDLSGSEDLVLLGCHERNLKNIDVQFKLGKLNVVSGKSGAGKSSLIKKTLIRALEDQLGIKSHPHLKLSGIKNLDKLNKLVFIDHSPIGKTPRSNPATYLGLSDLIRDQFAALPAAIESGLTKSSFSFNNKGGRCETCGGAGKIQIGMHYLGNVDLICETCNGDRFNEQILQIKWKGTSIADVYRLSVDEALAFFADNAKMVKGLQLLKDMGLGYLPLGQSSTTLSGGEAQRIKIANQLKKKDTGSTLYVIVEPSIGLHHENIQSLLHLFDVIKKKGNTIVCVEQNEELIAQADWHIELGPEGGKKGGEIIFQGIPRNKKSIPIPLSPQAVSSEISDWIILRGVKTHTLKNCDVQFPKNRLSVVTGLSGSGKSSLIYNTLLAEANARFTESFSTYNRSFIQQNNEAILESYSGLGPAIGINQKGGSPSKRSTVGTMSGIYDSFRLIYSRIAQLSGKNYTAQHYSFNHHLGACDECKGLGIKLMCDPNKIIVNPQKSILEGAISKNKVIRYYAAKDGQFMATLHEVANHEKWDLSVPWEQLPEKVKNAVLFGTGDKIWDVSWKFTTKSRKGIQKIATTWKGFCELVNDEYQRKLHNKNVKEIEILLHEVQCPKCYGKRLKEDLLTTTFLDKNISELSEMAIVDCLQLLSDLSRQTDDKIFKIASSVLPSVKASLQRMIDLGLGYLSLNRSADTLSGGERQRIALAGQFSANLYGVIYVLDEPTIGLDEKQIEGLINVLKSLVAKGNTVITVEHDPIFIRHADYIVEMGPKAGRNGGNVIYQGELSGLQHIPESVTHRLLSLPPQNETGNKKRRKGVSSFGVKGAFANNLKDIDVVFSSERITAITGVSGSGKSSLMRDVLFASYKQNRPVGCRSIFGFDQFEEVLFIDQEPVSKNRLITPASYSGILKDLQSVYAKEDFAKSTGLKRADFSYLSKKGKCPICGGYGKVKTAMDFMSDVWLRCDSCAGLRYNNKVLACKFKEKTIGDVLQMTVEEALDFFETDTVVHYRLSLMKQLGIGHLVLGQAGNTLSGGESQRLKLVTALTEKSKGKRLFLFDEPSAGLHYFDIVQLIDVFDKMVDAGDSIIYIEHNSTLIERADNSITLGWGSGKMGGALV